MFSPPSIGALLRNPNLPNVSPRTQMQIFFAIFIPLATFLVYYLSQHAFTDPTVASVASSSTHSFSKPQVSSITLIPKLGVAEDAHNGTTVQHRSRLHIQPPPTNLRQVHLLHKEILDEYKVKPGDLGENITTVHLNLLNLSKGTRLRFVRPGASAKEEREAASVILQGLRNPCPQIEQFRAGLQEKFIVKDSTGKIVERKAGVMATVEKGGQVTAGMKIVLEMPDRYVRMEAV